MTDYPRDTSSLRDAMLAFEPPAAAAAAYMAAITKGGFAPQVVGVFKALQHAPELSVEGQKLLCGCARMISDHSWFGLAAEANDVLLAVAPTLPPPPVETPVGEDVPE